MKRSNPVLSPEVRRACADILGARSKSFALASRLLSTEVRDEASVLYAWCRRADDAVDSPGEPGEKWAALERLDAELDAVFAGTPQQDPILGAFQSVVGGRDIPEHYPRELVAGMRMDVTGARYDSLEDLRLYCLRAAGTVGLMMSHVLGVSSPRASQHACDLGIAMQLTNICRDVHEDWSMGRLYVPLRLLAEAGAPDAGERLERGEPLGADLRAPFASVVIQLLEEADRYYASGDEGLPMLSLRSSFAIRTARNVYSAIGREVARRGCDVLEGRAVVPGHRKVALLVLALLATMAELPRRVRAYASNQAVAGAFLPSISG
ncbi:MAG: phytoene/squalene synthase family protein [Myxococcaceae bacterium]